MTMDAAAAATLNESKTMTPADNASAESGDWEKADIPSAEIEDRAPARMTGSDSSGVTDDFDRFRKGTASSDSEDKDIDGPAPKQKMVFDDGHTSSSLQGLVSHSNPQGRPKDMATMDADGDAKEVDSTSTLVVKDTPTVGDDIVSSSRDARVGTAENAVDQMAPRGKLYSIANINPQTGSAAAVAVADSDRPGENYVPTKGTSNTTPAQGGGLEQRDAAGGGATGNTHVPFWRDESMRTTTGPRVSRRRSLDNVPRPLPPEIATGSLGWRSFDGNFSLAALQAQYGHEPSQIFRSQHAAGNARAMGGGTGVEPAPNQRDNMTAATPQSSDQDALLSCCIIM
jgi:hypothetical protein